MFNTPIKRVTVFHDILSEVHHIASMGASTVYAGNGSNIDGNEAVHGLTPRHTSRLEVVEQALIDMCGRCAVAYISYGVWTSACVTDNNVSSDNRLRE